jgi:hypothetical protein
MKVRREPINKTNMLFDVSPTIANIVKSYTPDPDPDQEQFRMPICDTMEDENRLYASLDDISMEGFVHLARWQ